MGADLSQESAGTSDEIDSSIPHAARIYNYLLGGTDNFPVDREAAEQGAAIVGGWENARRNVRAQRDFLGRVVRHLAGDIGIRQLLDVGCGIPAEEHTHEVAHAVLPEARIVYVDNDPIVATHVRALLSSSAEGVTSYLDADLRDPEAILEQATATLDLAEPVAIILLGVLHHIEDEDDPWGVVARLIEGVSPGSYIAITHLSWEIQPEAVDRMASHFNDAMAEAMVLRSHDEISRLFDGVEILEPGIVPVQHWRPDDPEALSDRIPLSPLFGGIARKP